MKPNRIFKTLVLIMVLASQFCLVTNQASSAGQLILVDDLRMSSDGSGQWPPQVGDKVVAHIKVQNTGDQTINLSNIGVRGRRNGSENWDIGWWPAQLAPGQVWELNPNNERQLQDGSYSFRISYQDGSGWHEIGNEISFTAQSLPSAGQLALVDDLRISSDGSGQWPPQVGDKVVAHIKVKNTGGQTLNLSNIGVRGRRNGSENWDIGWWPTQLAPGQVWELNPNNERQLQEGSYSFRISYQDGSGWHEIGNEINFSVQSISMPEGHLVLVDNLRMWSNGSGQWPPRVGDKVVAHIKVQNTGGQTLNLSNIGVRGRRNGSENWDIGWWPTQLAPGQVWELNPNNERQLQEGSYSFRISYQDGSGWQEIGNEIRFSVQRSLPIPPSAGQLILVDDLRMSSDGSGQWPPQVGDKVVAHIKIQNTGGQTLNLSNIGVRGRRNGSENWDIGWWPTQLAPGQFWELNPNNERQLQEGSYSFRISYQDASGWHEIGSEINFSVRPTLNDNQSNNMPPNDQSGNQPEEDNVAPPTNTQPNVNSGANSADENAPSTGSTQSMLGGKG